MTFYVTPRSSETCSALLEYASLAAVSFPAPEFGSSVSGSEFPERLLSLSEMASEIGHQVNS